MKGYSFKNGFWLLLLLALAGGCKTDHRNQLEEHCLIQLPELQTTTTTNGFREAANGDKLRSTVLQFTTSDAGILEQSLSAAGYVIGPMPEPQASRFQAAGVRPENYYYKIVRESEKEVSLCVMNSGLNEVGFYRIVR